MDFLAVSRPKPESLLFDFFFNPKKSLRKTLVNSNLFNITSYHFCSLFAKQIIITIITTTVMPIRTNTQVIDGRTPPLFEPLEVGITALHSNAKTIDGFNQVKPIY